MSGRDERTDRAEFAMNGIVHVKFATAILACSAAVWNDPGIAQPRYGALKRTVPGSAAEWHA